MSNRGSEPTVIIFLTKHSTSFVVGKGQGWRNLQRSPLVVLGKNVCLLFILKGKRLRGELVKSSLFHPHAFNENTTFIIVILWQWGNRLGIKGTCHWTNGTPWTILSIFNIWGRGVYMVWVSVIWILGSLSEMYSCTKLNLVSYLQPAIIHCFMTQFSQLLTFKSLLSLFIPLRHLLNLKYCWSDLINM